MRVVVLMRIAVIPSPACDERALQKSDGKCGPPSPGPTVRKDLNIMKNVIAAVAAALICLCHALHASAFVHPGLPLTRSELNRVKARIRAGDQPWKSGFNAMAADWHSKLNYRMQGPFADVSRNPNVHLYQWENDMQAVYNQSLMWYFTGNAAYARKAAHILLAWARTQKKFGGMESDLDLGDFAYRFAGGADILRGTWPGWTPADTAAVKHLFGTVYWPGAFNAGHNILGPANKGMLALSAACAIAIFNDDKARLAHVIHLYRTQAATALRNTLPTGESGESGRDQGHAWDIMKSMAFICEACWAQGIDLYSEDNNRLLAVGEYWARVNSGVKTPFTPFGPIDAYYLKSAAGGWPHGRLALNMLYDAYVLRKGLQAPYIQMRRSELPIDDSSSNNNSFVFYRNSAHSSAQPLPPVRVPPAPAEPVTGGLRNFDIGQALPRGQCRYHNGIWTVKGAGIDIWGPRSDSCQFVYKPVEGNCTIIAKVDSIQRISVHSKAAVMIRESMRPDAPSAWIAVTPAKLYEFTMSGWSNLWGGSYFAKAGRAIPMSSYWLKIERIGDMITLFVSPDGTSWGTACVGKYAHLPYTLYLGLAVCSHHQGRLAAAQFSHVRITGGVGFVAPTRPEAPLAVVADPGNRQVPLRWLKSFGATAYLIKRSSRSGGPFRTIATIPAGSGESYIDRSVVNGKRYHYVVVASNAAGDSGPSSVASVLPDPPLVRVSKHGIAAAYAQANAQQGPDKAFDNLAGTQWFSGSHAGGRGWIGYDLGAERRCVVTRYDITNTNALAFNPKSWEFQGSNDGRHWITLDTRRDESFRGGLKSFSIHNTTAYRFYRLKITATHGADGIQLAGFDLFAKSKIPLPPAPWKPTALTASRPSGTQVDLKWNTAHGAVSYNVERSTTPRGPYVTIIRGVTSNMYRDQRIKAGRTYYYKVRAMNCGGISRPSAVVEAKALAAWTQ